MAEISFLRLFWAAFPAALVSTLSWFSVFTFLNSYLVKGLGYSNAQWTSATLWFTCSMIIWPIVYIELAAWLGRRRTVTLALAISTLSYALFALSRSAILLTVGMVLLAGVQVAIFAIWLSMVAEIGGQKPGRALGLVNWVGTVTSAAVLLGGGYLIEWLDYRPAFMVCAVVCLLCAIGYHVATRGLTPTTESDQVLALSGLAWADVRALLHGPLLVVMLAGLCMEPFNYHTANQLFPNLARDVHGQGETAISSIVAIGRLPALLTLWLIVHWIDRVNSLRWYGGSMVLSGLAVVAMGLAGSAGWILAGYVGYYLAYGLVWGTNTAALNASVPARLRDAGFAVMMILSTSALFGVGFVHNRMLTAGVRLPEVFVWCGLLGTVGGLLLWGYSWRRAAGRKEPRPGP